VEKGVLEVLSCSFPFGKSSTSGNSGSMYVKSNNTKYILGVKGRKEGRKEGRKKVSVSISNTLPMPQNIYIIYIIYIIQCGI
jgi:hypothetical protein